MARSSTLYDGVATSRKRIMNILIDESQLVAAYTSFLSESGATADSILVNPLLRTRFLNRVRQQLGEVEEESVLRKLLNLRKKSRLPRG
jgi:hypothetical protein